MQIHIRNAGRKAASIVAIATVFMIVAAGNLAALEPKGLLIYSVNPPTNFAICEYSLLSPNSASYTVLLPNGQSFTLAPTALVGVVEYPPDMKKAASQNQQAIQTLIQRVPQFKTQLLAVQTQWQNALASANQPAANKGFVMQPPTGTPAPSGEASQAVTGEVANSRLGKTAAELKEKYGDPLEPPKKVGTFVSTPYKVPNFGNDIVLMQDGKSVLEMLMTLPDHPTTREDALTVVKAICGTQALDTETTNGNSEIVYRWNGQGLFVGFIPEAGLIIICKDKAKWDEWKAALEADKAKNL